eukprot:scaffold1330_cov240-Pinguiococcus_pyrenoidosus.AAC.12
MSRGGLPRSEALSRRLERPPVDGACEAVSREQHGGLLCRCGIGKARCAQGVPCDAALGEELHSSVGVLPRLRQDRLVQRLRCHPGRRLAAGEDVLMGQVDSQVQMRVAIIRVLLRVLLVVRFCPTQETAAIVLELISQISKNLVDNPRQALELVQLSIEGGLSRDDGTRELLQSVDAAQQRFLRSGEAARLD